MSDSKMQASKLVAKFGAVEAGRRCDVSRQMIAAIASGERNPAPATAERIAKAFAAIPPDPPKNERTKRDEKTTIDSLLATIDDIDDTLADDIPATAKASLYRARIDALDRIAKLRGEHELTMQALTRSRLWRDLLARLAPVLEKHPEAASDIADVLGGLET